MNDTILKAAASRILKGQAAPQGAKTPKTFRIHGSTADQLEQIAKGTGMTKTEIVERSISDLHSLYSLSV